MFFVILDFGFNAYELKIFGKKPNIFLKKMQKNLSIRFFFFLFWSKSENDFNQKMNPDIFK